MAKPQNQKTQEEQNQLVPASLNETMPTPYKTGLSDTMDAVGRVIGVIGIDQQMGLFVDNLSGTQIEEFDAFILSVRVTRARFVGETFAKGQKPECKSQDGVVSVEGKFCKDCEFSEKWEDNKPACARCLELLLWNKDENRPMILRARGSSYSPVRRYLSWIEQCRFPLPSVLTHFKLDQKQRGQNVYFQVHPESVEVVKDKERFTEICTLGKTFGVEFTSRDLDTEEAEEQEQDIPF